MLEQHSDDIRATLAISSAEALNGTTRTLTLPGGRQVTIPVPAGTRDGQEIHIAGQGLSSSRGGPAGALILTIFIVSTDHPGAPSYSQRASDFPTEFSSAPGTSTYPQGASNLPTEISSAPPNTSSYPQRGSDYPTEIKSVPPPPPPQTYTGLPSTDPGGTFTPHPFQTGPAYPPHPSLYERPQPAVQASSQQHRSLSRSMAILLAIVALLVIGAGGLIYYVTVVHRSQMQIQATPTAQVNVTSTAQVAATGQAQANATLTAVAQTNILATATASSQQTGYNQATSGTPAINDPLSQQDSNNWDQGANCAFAGGAYHAIVPQQNTFVSCSPNTASATFSNFAFQVQMTISKGDYGGMLFRSNSTGVNYYFLSIDQTGFYSLIVYKNDTQIKTLSSGTSSAFKTGLNQPNVITVVAQGSNLSLYINGQLVTKANDSTYTSGDIAMIAGDVTHSTDVAFSNVKVWNL